MKAALKNNLRDWVKQTRAEMDPKAERLIGKAVFDLHYGPGSGDPTYPGFEKATKILSRAIREVVPSTLYVDTFSDNWVEREPRWDETDEEGGLLYHQEEWITIDRSDLVAALVGDSLAPYVR